VLARLARLGGILRSLVVYWRPGRQRGLQALYRPFVPGGGLVFDVGAHLGDRTRAFAALGARVVAVEPQPHLLPWLRRLVGGRPGVRIEAVALGKAEGTTWLQVSRLNPTVSTASAAWRREVGEDPGFRRVRWNEAVEVPVTTLDRLVERHGLPDFVKIDVEGFEARVLAGLSRPVPALSLEFIGAAPGAALEALARLEGLGPYRFNAVAGEGRRFHHPRWMSASEARHWLSTGADGLASGDLYAALSPPAVAGTRGSPGFRGPGASGPASPRGSGRSAGPWPPRRGG
jgi:FkbM family methyltransferase